LHRTNHLLRKKITAAECRRRGAALKPQTTHDILQNRKHDIQPLSAVSSIAGTPSISAAGARFRRTRPEVIAMRKMGGNGTGSDGDRLLIARVSRRNMTDDNGYPTVRRI